MKSHLAVCISVMKMSCAFKVKTLAFVRQDCLKSGLDWLWTGRVAVYVGCVVMVSHTLRHTHYSVCGAAWWWYFILGSMAYSKVGGGGMSIALNHVWISYHHTMCLWCGYGVSACLDASICVSYFVISVSNKIKHRPFLLLHIFYTFLLPSGPSFERILQE